MRIEVERKSLEDVEGTLVIPFHIEGGRPQPSATLPPQLHESLKPLLGAEFNAKLEETYAYPIRWGRLSRVILTGVGERGEELLPDRVRRAYGKAVQVAGQLGLREVSAILPTLLLREDVAQTVAEGILLASYRYERYKSEDEKRVERVSIISGEDLEEEVERARKICMGVWAARDIANTPPSDCTPDKFEEMVRAEIRGLPIVMRVFGVRELEKMGMGGILAVGRGSSSEPRLIVLEYGEGSQRPYVVVGKAVTFDSGGLSLKPAEKMEEMKFDKSGGAAVVGILKAAALLKLPARIVGLIPVVENMPSGSAYKPGDVIRFRNGKTAEIINTDAEGRLILADALAYGSEMNPKAMIDLATLTGACVIALGTHASGLFTNNQELAEKLKESGERTGERVWQLPLWKPYYEQLKSEVADMKNVGGRPGGAITAAAFLSNFVAENIPWAHLDIAGTAWTQETSEQKSINPKGATGVGVRLIIDFLLRELSSN